MNITPKLDAKSSFIDAQAAPGGLIIPHPDDVYSVAIANVEHVAGFTDRAFAILSRRSKRPDQPGWNRRGYTVQTCLSAINRGCNIGLIAGLTDDLALIDIDRDVSKFLAQFPIFKKTTRFFRFNAQEKAKFIVRINGDKPRSMKHFVTIDGDRQSVFELISTSGQAVIAGTHVSGAIIECNYAEPITITFEELSVIVKRYTGRSIERQTISIIDKPSYENQVVDDIERAKQNLARLKPERADDYDQWIRVGLSLKALGMAGLQLWEEWSRQSSKYKPGECRQLWPKMNAQRITARSLTHMANEDEPSSKWTNNKSESESETRQLAGRWAAIILDYPFDGRSSEHKRAIALAFLKHAYKADNSEFAASYEQLAIEAGVSKQTVANHMKTNPFDFMIEHITTGDFIFSSTWRLRPIEPHLETLTHITLNVGVLDTTYTLHSKYMRLSLSTWLSTWCQCGFIDSMGDDAFVAPRVGGKKRKEQSTRQPDDGNLSPKLSLEERRKAILARTIHRETLERNTDIYEGQYKSLKPFQKTSLRILDLYERGLRGNPAEFANEMGCGAQTVRDAIKRMSDNLAAYDIEPVAWIQRNCDGSTEVHVAENWRELVAKARPYMVTDGIQSHRNLRGAVDRIARAEVALEKVKTGRARAKLEAIIDGAAKVLQHIDGAQNQRKESIISPKETIEQAEELNSEAYTGFVNDEDAITWAVNVGAFTNREDATEAFNVVAATTAKVDTWSTWQHKSMKKYKQLQALKDEVKRLARSPSVDRLTLGHVLSDDFGTVERIEVQR